MIKVSTSKTLLVFGAVLIVVGAVLMFSSKEKENTQIV